MIVNVTSIRGVGQEVVPIFFEGNLIRKMMRKFQMKEFDNERTICESIWESMRDVNSWINNWSPKGPLENGYVL
jgi:heme-degrading monooxygenase HmoA